MADLRTDYKDDIFTGNRKYLQIANYDGSISFEDVTDYEQEGDYFGSGQINETNEAINNLYKYFDYLETTITLSTSVSVNATFSNAAITTSSVIDVYTTDPKLIYENVTVTNGRCVVTFPKQKTQSTVRVRIYMK